MMNFEIQSHKALSEIVYEELKIIILTGRLKPGARMSEKQLAEDMGISRTPVREAIRKLENDGLVVIEHRKGIYVSEISVEDMLDILEARATLEGLAAAYAARRMNELKKQELLQVSKEFNQAVADCDMAEMVRIDMKFHQRIAEASGNSHLTDIIKQLQDKVLRYRSIYSTGFRRAEHMAREHKNILDAISEGKEEKAKSEAFNHVDRFMDIMIREVNYKEN